MTTETLCFTNRSERIALNNILGEGSGFSHGDVYMGLMSDTATLDPYESASEYHDESEFNADSNESGYARQGPITWSSNNQVGGFYELVNSNQIQFGTAETNTWPDIKGFALYDASGIESGNKLAYCRYSSLYSVAAGEYHTINAGGAAMRLGGELPDTIEGDVLQNMLDGGTALGHSSVDLALFSSDPGEVLSPSGEITRVSNVSFNAVTQSNGKAQRSNTNRLTFSFSASHTIDYWAYMRDASDQVCHGQFQNTLNVVSGQEIDIVPGELRVDLG